MKNVIFIVIDSFLYGKMGNRSFGPSPTPFLDSIKDHSVVVTNLFSQGPYTEAGNKALLTGSDSLLHGGYMHNLNQSNDIYLDVFKRNSYYTIEYFLPYYLYSYKDFKNIDKQYFTSDFIYNSVWSNRLKHFREVQIKDGLTDEDYQDIYTQLDLTFQAWENFLANDDIEKYKFIKRIVAEYDFDYNLGLLLKEKECFHNSPQAYADRVLEEGPSHNLFIIQNIDYDKYVDFDFFHHLFYSQNRKLVKEIRRKQFLSNIKNNSISIKKLFLSFFDKTNEYYRSVLFSLGAGFLVGQYKKGQFPQSLPSCRTLLRGCLKDVEDYKGNNPLCIHVHPEDLHNRTSFLTYDISDKTLLEHEVSLMKNYLSSLSSSYKGEIVYDLALLYVDDCIKELFRGLEKTGKLKDSVIAITSDHGYSYDCVPLRNSFVNNHHSENYHIPAIFYDGGVHKGDYSVYHTSKDVLPTIYELCGIDVPSSINGKSILQDCGEKKYAISEYVGGGCPDMRRRPIHYMIRDDKWLLVYYVKLFDDFKSGEITELYDLINDKEELHNVKDKVETSTISYLLSALKEHHLYLQKNQ